MPRIIYEPAECVPECDQPDCHYMHTEAWLVGDKVFRTQREAEEYVAGMAPCGCVYHAEEGRACEHDLALIRSGN